MTVSLYGENEYDTMRRNRVKRGTGIMSGMSDRIFCYMELRFARRDVRLWRRKMIDKGSTGIMRGNRYVYC